MSLSRRPRRTRFGAPEGIALVLLGITLGSGGMWWLTQAPAGWTRAPASVLTVMPARSESGIEGGDSEFEVKFTYWADGAAREGRLILGPVRSAVFKRLPLAASFEQKRGDFITLDDFPPAFRELLAVRGITRLDRIPRAYLDVLRRQGYTQVKSFTDDFRRAVREDNYAAAAALLDKALPGPLGADSRGVSGGAPIEASEKASAAEQEKARYQLPLRFGGNPWFHVLYDMRRPWVYRVSFMPNFGVLMCVISFVLGAASSFLYCGWVYPRVKRWRE